jgi:hypothetical protein
MTEEERFSTITITKKTKNTDSSPTYAPFRGGGLLGKKDKSGHWRDGLSNGGSVILARSAASWQRNDPKIYEAVV